MATHSNILAWRIPRTEKPGGLDGVSKSQTLLSDSTTATILKHLLDYLTPLQKLRGLPLAGSTFQNQCHVKRDCILTGAPECIFPHMEVECSLKITTSCLTSEYLVGVSS